MYLITHVGYYQDFHPACTGAQDSTAYDCRRLRNVRKYLRVVFRHKCVEVLHCSSCRAARSAIRIRARTLRVFDHNNNR